MQTLFGLALVGAILLNVGSDIERAVNYLDTQLDQAASTHYH